MRKHLLPETGHAYKVNLHCHTTLSDGQMTPSEVKAHYKTNGYSAVAFTDHDLYVPHPELSDDEFIALHGYELEVDEDAPGKPFKTIRTCHMCFVALDPETDTPVCWNEEYVFPKCKHNIPLVKTNPSEPPYVRSYTHEGISDLMQRGREGGFFVTYNHPTWSMERYSEYSGYTGMHAMEIMNYGCIVAGYPEYNDHAYDDLLKDGRRIYAVAGDDNHGDYDVCGTYTTVIAPRLGYRELTDALLKGHFYSSEGPEIKALYLEDGKLVIETSPASSIYWCSDLRRTGWREAKEGESITRAVFDFPSDVGYFRFTVTDGCGKKAYTNAYFVDEL